MGYELPEIINPPTIKFCIEVPDEPLHLRAFWGALWELARPYNWDNDDDHTALEVGALWKELWFKNHSQWRERECMSCGDEMCDKLDRIIELLEGGFKIVPINAITKPPDEGAGDCAPDHFDHDGDGESSEELERRQKALCLTVNQYVKAILMKVLRDMNAAQSLIDYVDGLFPDVTVPLSLTNLTVLYPNPLFSLGFFFDALANDLDISEVACAMFDGLTGDKNNTSSNFRDSLAGVDLGDSGLNHFVTVVSASNGVSQNYKDFNTTLNANNTETVDDYECPCIEPVSDCEFPIVLTADFKGAGGVNIVLEEVEPSIWHITNNVPYETSPNIRYLGAYRDENNQCIKLVPLPDGYPAPQGIIEHDKHGCCGYPNSVTTGGYETNGILDVSWTTSDPVDTYVKVVCMPPEECV